ncbi:DUF2177 family protein [Candidatus Mycosynbacter amalyticus]|uniref:DUF2177 family protein n=1 Tax=Candidatus Mycosynbacter amalyticus TaxID=2665156 RepID=A0A857MKF7_9BACT|nr:DUF2177 family protein [Candidatus Mycosynbacter amalyticus]QHN43043.1 DUF2177 family protein [Candidatus Mycosynbacter amalyticus]
MELLIKLLAVGGIMGILDYIWLGFIAKKLYYAEMGKLLLDKPNMGAALAFYLIYVVGVLVFVINPALAKESWQYALGIGALFGLVAYATYDLTNLATMKDFPLKIVIIDLAWGMLITAAVSVGSFFIIRALT